MASTLPLLVLLVLSLYSSSSVLVPVSAGVAANVDWQWSGQLANYYRGQACVATRKFPYNGATDGFKMNGGYMTSSPSIPGTWVSSSLSIPSVTPLVAENAGPGGDFLGREGHVYHFGYSASLNQMYEFVTAGRNSTDPVVSAATLMPAFNSIAGADWNGWQTGSPWDYTYWQLYYPSLAPSWNYSYTQMIDAPVDQDWIGWWNKDADFSTLGVIYGGVAYGAVYDPTWLGSTIDNAVTVIRTNWTTPTSTMREAPLAYGNYPPFGCGARNHPTARWGMALASFNLSTIDDPARGNLIMMGGMNFGDHTLNNDVWISQSGTKNAYSEASLWKQFTCAPWAPRYWAQAFDGGRRGVFLYGGYTTSSLTWTSELWYGQFPSDPYNGVAASWYSVTQSSGTGPNYQPACNTVFWGPGGKKAFLIMMGIHSDDSHGVIPAPVKDYFVGEVTFASLDGVAPVTSADCDASIVSATINNNNCCCTN